MPAVAAPVATLITGLALQSAQGPSPSIIPQRVDEADIWISDASELHFMPQSSFDVSRAAPLCNYRLVQANMSVTHMLLHAAGDHLGDAHAGTTSSHHADALVFERMQRLALHCQRPIQTWGTEMLCQPLDCADPYAYGTNHH